MTGPSEVDPAVLAGEPGSAQQLEGGDDDLPVVGQDLDAGAADDALIEGRPTGPGGPH
jgi:hypothetical protein